MKKILKTTCMASFILSLIAPLKAEVMCTFNGKPNQCEINQGHRTPLTRGSDGALGVKMPGGGGGININFTINATDAKGIDTLLIERKSLITNIVRSAVAERGGRL